MIRTTLLAATSVAALSISSAGACTLDSLTLTCAGANPGFTSNTDDVVIDVPPGASVVSNSRAMTLGGANQTMNNDGLVQSTGSDAVRSTGPNLTFNNDGDLFATGRGIRLYGAASGATIFNGTDGVISTGNRAIAAENEAFDGEGTTVENVTVINHGLIGSANARAMQLRGDGTTVVNHGIIAGAEEVIEARIGFTLENHGLIVLEDGVADEDGVQFASGTVDNWGTIQGSDDGIDVDEGTIRNHATGQILSLPADSDLLREGNAIDADVLLQDPSVPEARQAQAGLLKVFNEGLITGPRAISGAAGRTGAIEVHNTGTLEGTDTAAIDFALSMAGSLVKLAGESTVYGSVLMTDSDDIVEIGPLDSGVLLENITDSLIAVFDGRGGEDTVHLGAYTLANVLSFAVSGNEAVLNLATAAGSVSGIFRNFEFWKVGSTTHTTAELAALAPIPVPAGLPLLGAGLGALWVLRRRRAA